MEPRLDFLALLFNGWKDGGGEGGSKGGREREGGGGIDEMSRMRGREDNRRVLFTLYVNMLSVRARAS